MTAGLAVCALALSVLPIQSLLAGNRDAAQPMLARALAALDRGDARTARVELLNAVKADPNWAAPRLAQARAMLALGDGRTAQDAIERARTLGTAPGGTRAMMAHALLMNDDPVRALAEAQAKDVPRADTAYAARIAAVALATLGRVPPAFAAFDKALALTPDDPMLWLDIARFRRATGDRAAALLASDRAMALAPGDPAALTLRAEMVRAQYGPVAALPWFDKAIAIAPDYLPALTEYAATLADMGRARQMLALTRRIIARDPSSPRAFFMQATMAARAGDMGLARRMLDRTAGRLDDQPATMLLRGILYLDGGNATLAADQFKTLLSRQPFNFRARLLYGRALAEAGQLREADVALTPLAMRDDADGYVLTLSARIRERLGDRIAADALLARATRPDRATAALLPLDPDPDSLSARAVADPSLAGPNISYIRVLLSQGQGNAAVARATTLRNDNPGAPQAHVALGDTLAEVGRWAEAARAYTAAANLTYDEATALRLATAWNRAAQPTRAEQALGLFLTQNPQNIAAMRLAATAWMRTGQWPRAVDALEKVRAQTGNRDAWLFADLAWAWLGRGDAARALVYARQSYRLQPAGPVTTDAYGWLLFKAQGASRASVDLLEKAVLLAPGNALLRDHLKIVKAAQAKKN